MGGVFISYRRDDSDGQARALFNELSEILGEQAVFMDVDNITLGRDFREALQERLGSSDVMLTLIGPDWLESKDTAGNCRLNSPVDYVRQEIATALRRNIPVTPVLVRGARLPAAEQLPDDLKDLVYRQGFELRHSHWSSDVAEMVKRLGLSKTATLGARSIPADPNGTPLRVREPVKEWVVDDIPADPKGRPSRVWETVKECVDKIPADPKGRPSRVWETVKEWVDDIVAPDYLAQNESEEVVGKWRVYLMRSEMAEDFPGLVFLTNQRVRFEPSHDIRAWQRLLLRLAALVSSRDRVAAWLSSTRLSIPLSAIASVVYSSRRSGLFKGQRDLITILCRSGEEYQFGVNRGRFASVTPPDLKEMAAKIETYRERFQSIS